MLAAVFKYHLGWPPSFTPGEAMSNHRSHSYGAQPPSRLKATVAHYRHAGLEDPEKINHTKYHEILLTGSLFHYGMVIVVSPEKKNAKITFKVPEIVLTSVNCSPTPHQSNRFYGAPRCDVAFLFGRKRRHCAYLLLES